MAKGKGACASTSRPDTSTSPRGLVMGSVLDFLPFENPDFSEVLGSPARPLEVDLLNIRRKNELLKGRRN